MQTGKVVDYDRHYQNLNYFGYQEWVYDRYIASLIRASGLRKGSTVIDVGCGQGFFSYLLRKHGMDVLGIDNSEVGIEAAKAAYGQLGIRFAVADVENELEVGQFDCVFVRGLSLYNKVDFADDDRVTNSLFKLVRSGGVMMFLYHSNFSTKRSEYWRYHSWDEMRKHFSRYKNAKFWFSLRFDALVLGTYAFSTPCTKLNRLISKVSSKGGDLICVLRKP
jgi:SAM-dependent methyltransferase